MTPLLTPLLEGKALHFAYGGAPVLSGVDFTLVQGELVALVGPNGAGKSTLLQLLLGWLSPSAGAVEVGGRPVRDLSRAEIARQVAFVPQGGSGDFAFTVRELVAMGRTPHLGRFQPERPGDVTAIERALAATGTGAFAERLVSELSGGEQQRVHLGRALAQETAILLLDEPTASLDLEHQLEVMELVRGLVRGGKAAVVALHDLGLAARFADRVVVLASGGIVASGAPGDVITEAMLEHHFHIRARVRREVEDGVVVVVPVSPLG